MKRWPYPATLQYQQPRPLPEASLLETCLRTLLDGRPLPRKDEPPLLRPPTNVPHQPLTEIEARSAFVRMMARSRPREVSIVIDD